MKDIKDYKDGEVEHLSREAEMVESEYQILGQTSFLVLLIEDIVTRSSVVIHPKGCGTTVNMGIELDHPCLLLCERTYTSRRLS